MEHSEILNIVLEALPTPIVKNVKYGTKFYPDCLYFDYWGITYKVTPQLDVAYVDGDIQGSNSNTHLMEKCLELTMQLKRK